MRKADVYAEFPAWIRYMEAIDVSSVDYVPKLDKAGNPLPFAIFVRTTAGNLDIKLTGMTTHALVPLAVGINPYQCDKVYFNASNTSVGHWACYAEEPST